MVKILMITDNLRKGGKERRLLELLRYIDSKNLYEIELIILNNVIEYPAVFKLKNTKPIILERKVKKDPTIFFKIWKKAREFKPDIIHTWGSMPSIYAVPIVSMLRIPLFNSMIADANCNFLSSHWFRSRLVFPFSKRILANSKAGLNAFKVKSNKGRVVYNGFNFDRLNNLVDKDKIRNEYSIRTKYVIGMVAAFHQRKDYDTYLQVAKDICKERDDITFMAIGDGESRNNFISKYSDTKNIIFTGNLGDVENVINIFDIGVLLSNANNHLEGISNSILEMMALEKPVIASKGGGTDEIVLPDETGLLIDPFDKDLLKKHILTLIRNDQLRKELGNKAKNFVTEKFSIELMCSDILKIYDEMLVK